MYENIAWENFIKTGNVESFMEYKKITQLELSDRLNMNERSVRKYFSRKRKNDLEIIGQPYSHPTQTHTCTYEKKEKYQPWYH